MIQLPNKKYNIIYADPPWTFKTYSDKGKGRSAEQHYECMTLSDIKDLPIKDIAADDCVLFLWITDPYLEKAFDVLKSWEFIYKTVGFYWFKTNKDQIKFFTGLGYWTRANPEQCLLATRGKPKRISKSVQKLLDSDYEKDIVSMRREHSRKPDEARKRIVELMGDLPRIELFAREQIDGWDAWGMEINKF